MATALTLETAKAYVIAYYAACEPPVAADIEGCGMFSMQGVPIVRLNVSIPGGADQWDVWSEPLMDGALYGEC